MLLRAQWISMMHDQNRDTPLTLFLGWRNERLLASFHPTPDNNTSLINVTIKPFHCRNDQTTMLMLLWCWPYDILQSLGTQFYLLHIHTLFLSAKIPFHGLSCASKASRPLSCWATSIHIISPINDIAPSRFLRFQPVCYSIQCHNWF